MLARLTGEVPVPAFLQEEPTFLSDLYRASSGHAIELDIDTAALAKPHGAGTSPHYSLDLHYATRALTKNDRYDSRVGAIAVLYGSRYAHKKDVFGVMFDRGFSVNTPDDREKNRDIVGSPREGCAIFLDAIADARGANDVDRQVKFTTVHELGHLFNLLHIESPLNYLATSDPDTTYDDAVFVFHEKHSTQLARAASDPHVWPGGSDFFDLGSDLEQYDGVDHRERSRVRGNSPLSLDIKMARTSFRYFEPVERDVSVRLSPRAPRGVVLPDVIDPGYRAFQVWIEEPNGERRLYRSPRHYCEQGLRRRLRPGEVFHRDISIFGQSGGYTFRRSGVHRLWVELQVSPRVRLKSNTIEVELLPQPRESHASVLGEALRAPAVAQLLYYRLDRRGGAGMKILEHVLEARPQLDAAPGVRYALARAYLTKTSPKARERARDHMERALDSHSLGLNQRTKALQLLSGELSGLQTEQRPSRLARQGRRHK